MKKLWVLLGLLVVLSVGGYAAWTVFSAPQYSLLQVKKGR